MNFKATNSQKSLAKVLVSFVLITGTSYYTNKIIFNANDNPAYHQLPVTNNFNKHANPISTDLNGELEIFRKLRSRLEEFKVIQQLNKRLFYQKKKPFRSYKNKSY